jgi:hypothetical protein
MCGNSQGYVHYFASAIPDQRSYAIQAVDFITNAPAITLTIPNNTLTNGDIIEITGMLFIDPVSLLAVTTDLNDTLYTVNVSDLDYTKVTIYKWNGTAYTSFPFTPATDAIYVGGGEITLFPKMQIQTKDFNPYQAKGMQLKISYIDFLTDATPAAAISVQLFINSFLGANNQTNLLVGNKEVETANTPFGYITNISQTNPAVIASANHGLRTGQTVSITKVKGMTQINILNPVTVTYIDANTFSVNVDATAFSAYDSNGIWSQQSPGYFIPSSPTQYMWHRFFTTSTGQYIRINITYDDILMNQISTHEQDFQLNALSLWVRPGSKTIF